jgi:hypothetical protein
VIFRVVKIAYFREQIKNNWRVLNCGAGGGGREAQFVQLCGK